MSSLPSIIFIGDSNMRRSMNAILHHPDVENNEYRVELHYRGGRNLDDFSREKLAEQSRNFDRVVVLCGCNSITSRNDSQILKMLQKFDADVGGGKMFVVAMFQRKDLPEHRVVEVNKRLCTAFRYR